MNSKEFLQKEPLSIETNKQFDTKIETSLLQKEYQLINSILETNIKNNNKNNIKYLDEIYENSKEFLEFLPERRERGLSIKYKENNSYFYNNKLAFLNKKTVDSQSSINISNESEKYSSSISNITLKSTKLLLKYFFKSLNCIISKPVFLISGDKIIIQLFYYLNIPTNKLYYWFSIFNNKKILTLYKELNNKKYSKYIKKKSSSSKPTSRELKKIRFINLKTNLNINNKVFRKFFKIKYFNLKKKYLKINKEYFNNMWLGFAQPNIESEKVTKNLFFFNLFKYSLNKVFETKFNYICNILSKIFNRQVELQLTRLHQPYLESNILVNLLALALKRKKANLLIRKIFNKKPIKNINNLPILSTCYLLTQEASDKNKICNIRPNAFITGLNFNIAGRLRREPIIPRLTTKNFEKGSRALGKINYIDSSSITSKNKKGAFTIKIISGQNFYI